MPLLASVRQKRQNSENCVNYVVVPGVAGANLNDKTCPHFDGWLARLVSSCSTCAQSWVYDHDIRLEELKSWDRYSSTGEDLLGQLLSMQRKAELHDDDTFVLIGHRLGCYILKKALINACDKSFKDDENEFLNRVETIVMVGEPNLDRNKKDEWVDLVSDCISQKQRLPAALTDGQTIGALLFISETFESQMLLATLFDVVGTSKTSKKRRFQMKKKAYHGCIRSATVYVRVGTTGSEDVMLEKGPGDSEACSFDPKSANYGHLLALNRIESLPQITSGNTWSSASESDQTESSSIQESTSHDLASERQQPLPIGEVESVIEEPQNPSQQHDFQPITGDDGAQSVEELSPTLSRSSTEEIGIRADSANVANEQPETNSAGPRKRKTGYSAFVPPRDELFFGRSDLLGQLQEILLGIPTDGLPSQDLQKPTPKFTWLSGPPGIGKTSIVTEFTYRFMDQFDSVLWLNAVSEANLGRYCHESAVALGLVNGRTTQNHNFSRSKLMAWLNGTTSRWLLVFDDVSPRLDLTHFIPNSGNGAIVATARHPSPNFSASHTPEAVLVPGFTSQQALSFLLAASPDGKTFENAEAASRAAVRFHTSPIVLRQLINWSTRERISMNDINYLLDGKDVMLRFQTNPLDRMLSSATTRLNEDASSLLRLLSFVDLDWTHRTRLYRILFAATPLSGKDANSESGLSESLESLWKVALVDLNKQQNTIHIEKLVQRWRRTTLDVVEWHSNFRQISRSVKRQWPPSRKIKNVLNGFWEEFDPLHSQLSHLAACYVEECDFTQTVHDPGMDFKQLLINHTWYNARRGNHDRDLVHLAHFLITKGADIKDYHPALPRRCLKIPQDSISSPYLEYTQSRRGNYVALSYMWGSHTQRVSLTSANIAKLTKGIDVSDLPQVFRDAISLTQILGVDYLWIDSLCIVQDDLDELSDQVVHMAEIYENSLMTIAVGEGKQLLRIEDTKQDTCRIKPYTIYRNSTLESPLATSYWNRLWTVQESGISEKLASWVPVLTSLPQVAIRISVDSRICAPDSKDNGAMATISSESEPPPTGTDAAAQSNSGTEIAVSSRNVSSLSDSRKRLEEGQLQLLAGSFIEAAGSLTLFRDLLDLRSNPSQENLRSYALGSALLGTTYHLLKLDSVALGIVETAMDTYMRESTGRDFESPELGRLLLSAGIIFGSLGRIDDSVKSLQQSRKYLLDHPSEANEWAACVDIRLAETYLALKDFKRAHELLQSSMDYFETQLPSSKAQEHLARVLFRRSQVYEAEGRRAMHSALAAAAKEEYTTIKTASTQGASSSPVPADQLPVSLTAAHFDELVEPWHR